MKSIPNPVRITIIKTIVLIGGISVFGIIWGIISHDAAMLILSLLLAISGTLRVVPLIRYAKGCQFQTLVCTVISDRKSRLLNRHHLTYLTDDQEEKTVTINGRIVLKAGNRYRLYLSGAEEETATSSMPDFLKPGRTLIGCEILKD